MLRGGAALADGAPASLAVEFEFEPLVARLGAAGFRRLQEVQQRRGRLRIQLRRGVVGQRRNAGVALQAGGAHELAAGAAEYDGRVSASIDAEVAGHVAAAAAAGNPGHDPRHLHLERKVSVWEEFAGSARWDGKTSRTDWALDALLRLRLLYLLVEALAAKGVQTWKDPRVAVWLRTQLTDHVLRDGIQCGHLQEVSMVPLYGKSVNK